MCENDAGVSTIDLIKVWKTCTAAAEKMDACVIFAYISISL